MILSLIAGILVGLGLAFIAIYVFINWDRRAIHAYNNSRAKAVPACLHGRPVNTICQQCYDQEMVDDLLDRISQIPPTT